MSNFRFKIKKKFLVVAAIAALFFFYNGVASFFQPNESFIENGIPETAILSEEKTESTKENHYDKLSGRSFFKNLSGFISGSFSGDKKEETEQTVSNILPVRDDNSIKEELENYFIASSGLNFPDSDLINSAISLHTRGEEEGLLMIIGILKEKNGDLSGIIPPDEAVEIHRNTLLVGEKIIEVLEKISKTNNGEEIAAILQGPELREAGEVSGKTKANVEELISQYGLETAIQ